MQHTLKPEGLQWEAPTSHSPGAGELLPASPPGEGGWVTEKELDTPPAQTILQGCLYSVVPALERKSK